MKKTSIIEAIKHMLAMMLILNFALSLIPVLINPEAWFFGYKLDGIKASCWLLTNGIIGLILAYSLIRKIKYGFLAAFLFFVVNFINVMLIPLREVFSPFYSFGLILSLLGIVLEMRK